MSMEIRLHGAGQRSGDIDAVLCDIVEHSGFDLKTQLGRKALSSLVEVYDAVPIHTRCDLVWEPIHHALDCACLRPLNGVSQDCDCDPDVIILVEGLCLERHADPAGAESRALVD